jgi:ubiquitin-conjugating enzyme E2 J1
MSIVGTKWNANSASVKRIMQEIKELAEPNAHFSAHPTEDDIFEWHFTIRGAKDSDFDGGLYHGRILLPPEYPLKPPDIVMLTPSGRFEIGKKICLSATGFHPEHWRASWSIGTVLMAIISFMETDAVGAVGALETTSLEKKDLAKKSRSWKCSLCECSNEEHLPLPPDDQAEEAVSSERDESAAGVEPVTMDANADTDADTDAAHVERDSAPGPSTPPPVDEQQPVDESRLSPSPELRQPTVPPPTTPSVLPAVQSSRFNDILEGSIVLVLIGWCLSTYRLFWS